MPIFIPTTPPHEASFPSRALDTIYQNTTGKLILVIVSCYMTPGAVGGSLVKIKGQIGAASPPGTEAARAGLNFFFGDYQIDILLVFAVPAGYYYRVATETSGMGGEVITLTDWQEVQ